MNTISNASTPAAESSPPPAASTPSPRSRAKVSIQFLNRENDADLRVAIDRILASMRNNAGYPAPVPDLASIDTARNTFAAAVTALDRSKASLVRRNNARAALVPMLRDLALYVQHASQGDLDALIASGFPVQKGRLPVGTPSAPQNLRLRNGPVSGQLIGRCAPVRPAVSYQWRYASASAPTVWTLADPVASASITLEGLTRGTDYIVQVRAIGRKGPSDWSDAATLMAA
jgi:hypothetical protein